MSSHAFRMGDGEFDEVFIRDASVHIERMNETAFWIGIEPPKESGLPPLMLNTGVYRGTWYFNIEADSPESPEWLKVQRPRTGVNVAPLSVLQRQNNTLRSDLARAEARIRELEQALEQARTEIERLRAGGAK